MINATLDIEVSEPQKIMTYVYKILKIVKYILKQIFIFVIHVKLIFVYFNKIQIMTYVFKIYSIAQNTIHKIICIVMFVNKIINYHQTNLNVLKYHLKTNKIKQIKIQTKMGVKQAKIRAKRFI